MQRWATVRRTQRLLGPTVALGILAACSGSDAAPTPTTARPSLITTPTPSTVPGDGVMRIGLLLPRSGPGADLGEALTHAAELAVGEINTHGGVAGHSVELIGRDEGSDIATAGVGLSGLIAAGADVIIGPASSTIALGVLRQAVDAHKVVCSPTASALELDGFPDDGYFVRTIPSDRLQAAALADLISRSGRRTASIFAPDDDFGEGFRTALTAQLTSRGIKVDTTVAYDQSSEALTTVTAAAGDSRADLLVVIGEPASGSRVLAAVGASSDARVPIFVNDALRRTSLSESATAGAPLLARVHGVSPAALPPPGPFLQALTADDATRSIYYSAYAYDCVMLAALSAVAEGADDPAKLVAAMVENSSQGARCYDFATCSAKLVPGFNVDFDGVSGRLELDGNGEVTSAMFEEFAFDDMGRDITVGQIPINP